MKATRTVVILAGTVAVLAALLWLRAEPRPPILIEAKLAVLPNASLKAAASSPRVAVRAPSNAASAHTDAGASVEVCGVGKVRLDDPRGEEFFDARMKHAEADWSAALQASSDAHARAAGLMWARPEQSEAIAQLALQNGDAVVYALALNACARAEYPSVACGQISLDSWARLDADNAVPWLQMASRARLQSDIAGEGAAMEHAAAAHRVDDYNFSLYAYMQSSLPAGVGVLEEYFLAIEALGRAFASGGTQYPEAAHYCSKDAVSDSSVADRCRALAELLETRGNTLLDLGIAKAVGARVGWSPQRVDAAGKYLEALRAESEATGPRPGPEQFSCGALAASNAYIRDLSSLGEVGALRERLERSGMSVPEDQQPRDGSVAP